VHSHYEKNSFFPFLSEKHDCHTPIQTYRDINTHLVLCMECVVEQNNDAIPFFKGLVRMILCD